MKPRNTKPLSKRFPYELINGTRVGCYSTFLTALNIAKHLEGYWLIRGIEDQILAEAD